MTANEIQKSKIHVLIEIVEYVPNSVVCKTIIGKTTGIVDIMASDSGENISEGISPFDTFIQVLEGQAEVVIDGKLSFIKTGEGVIIPAHSNKFLNSKNRFKMITTVIKSGYENISL